MVRRKAPLRSAVAGTCLAPSCTTTECRQWGGGPDGPSTLCFRCYSRYSRKLLPLFRLRSGRLSVRPAAGATRQRVVAFPRRGPPTSRHRDLRRPHVIPWRASSAEPARGPATATADATPTAPAFDATPAIAAAIQFVASRASGGRRRCMRASCRTANTSEWRTGPDGNRTLCRSCYCHYSRHRLPLYQCPETAALSVVAHPGWARMRIVGFANKTDISGVRPPVRDMNCPLVKPAGDCQQDKDNLFAPNLPPLPDDEPLPAANSASGATRPNVCAAARRPSAKPDHPDPYSLRRRPLDRQKRTREPLTDTAETERKRFRRVSSSADDTARLRATDIMIGADKLRDASRITAALRREADEKPWFARRLERKHPQGLALHKQALVGSPVSPVPPASARASVRTPPAIAPPPKPQSPQADTTRLASRGMLSFTTRPAPVPTLSPKRQNNPAKLRMVEERHPCFRPGQTKMDGKPLPSQPLPRSRRSLFERVSQSTPPSRSAPAQKRGNEPNGFPASSAANLPRLQRGEKRVSQTLVTTAVTVPKREHILAKANTIPVRRARKAVVTAIANPNASANARAESEKARVRQEESRKDGAAGAETVPRGIMFSRERRPDNEGQGSSPAKRPHPPGGGSRPARPEPNPAIAPSMEDVRPESNAVCTSGTVPKRGPQPKQGGFPREPDRTTKKADDTAPKQTQERTRPRGMEPGHVRSTPADAAPARPSSMNPKVTGPAASRAQVEIPEATHTDGASSGQPCAAASGSSFDGKAVSGYPGAAHAAEIRAKALYNGELRRFRLPFGSSFDMLVAHIVVLYEGYLDPSFRVAYHDGKEYIRVRSDRDMHELFSMAAGDQWDTLCLKVY